MQIVIKIKDTAYEAILNADKAGGNWGNDLLGILCNAVANGTPLPKGHGVLKDVTNLMRGLYTDIQTIEETFTSSDVYKMIDEECSTIIEADKSESEDEEWKLKVIL